MSKKVETNIHFDELLYRLTTLGLLGIAFFKLLESATYRMEDLRKACESSAVAVVAFLSAYTYDRIADRLYRKSDGDKRDRE